MAPVVRKRGPIYGGISKRHNVDYPQKVEEQMKLISMVTVLFDVLTFSVPASASDARFKADPAVAEILLRIRGQEG